jgi:predicted XRE-type DNA-binding protein
LATEVTSHVPQFADPFSSIDTACGPELPHDTAEDVFLDARMRVPIPPPLKAYVEEMNLWSVLVFRAFWSDWDDQEKLNTGERKLPSLQALVEFMHVLTKSNERKIAMRVECYLAAINQNPKSQTQIAQEYGVTRAAVSKIILKICQDLQLPTARHMKSEQARQSYRERALRIHQQNKSKICKQPTSNSHHRLSTLRSALMQTLVPQS